MDNISLEIVNWSNFQTRRELNKLTWFRLESDIFDGEMYFNLKNDGLIFFIFLLTLAAKKNSEAVTFNLKFVCEKLKLKKDEILSYLNILEQKQIVRVIAQNSPILSPTVQTNKQTNNIVQIELDFESAYNLYPNKKGKTRGMYRIKQAVKTQEDLLLFIKAIENYSFDLKKNRTEQRFIKYFDSFVSCWRDWVDYERKELNPISTKQKEETFNHIETFKYNDEARLKAIDDAKKNNLLKQTIEKIKAVK